MKPGDKVWFFASAGEIIGMTIDSIDEEFIFGHVGDGMRVRLALPYPYFPTREALCEHYKKIFE